MIGPGHSDIKARGEGLTRLLIGLATGWSTAVSVYPAVLVLAAAVGARPDGRRQGTARTRRHVVLVPAHDEEQLIGGTVWWLLGMDFPDAAFDVVVIADNCTDRTAEVARAAGAEVWVRTDPLHRGKGYSLEWAIARLLESSRQIDVIVVVDADCRVAPDFLARLDDRIVEGADAVQGSYTVANPGDSATAALRYAGFAVVNHVRPLGRDRLGLSAGITGSGFALTRSLLERVPWKAASLVEDREYHARLVEAGERVVFAADARLVSPMPTTLQASTQQNLRWEEGNRQQARTWTRRLLRAALRRRKWRTAVSAVEMLLPPQSVALAGNAAVLAVGVVFRQRAVVVGAAATIVLQTGALIGSLALVRAPRRVYLDLSRAPLVMAWKLTLYARILAGRGPRAWVGTRSRESAN